MEFLKAIETIMNMHKACACGPNEAKKTGKPICPLYHTAFPCTDIVSFEIEEREVDELLEAWNKYYTGQTRPTWRKLLDAAGITVRCDGTLQFNTRFEADKPVSDEFMHMLGIVRNGGNNGT